MKTALSAILAQATAIGILAGCSTMSGMDACCAPGASGLAAEASGSSFFGAGPAARSTATPRIRAICVLHPTPGNTARGVVTFAEVDGGTRIEAEITGLTPGKHGFHIHDFGDCSAADAASAGGHYNPDSHPHGGPGSAIRHPGDLGNLEADASGNARLVLVEPHPKLRGAHSVIGRAVIVHAKVDDLVTQPTGNAGARVACGVIGIAKSK
jgi:superoxide dismutase, Cu-Zn family